MDRQPQKSNIESDPSLLFQKINEKMKVAGVLSLGDFLAIPGNLGKIKYKKIALLGESNTGKSTLAYGVRDWVNSAYKKSPVFVLTRANADGQGAWTSATARADIVRATKLKHKAKGNFGLRFEAEAIRSISGIGNERTPLNLIDIGGMPNDSNIRIASNANLAILLLRREMIDSGSLDKWLGFCKKANLPILACVVSDIEGDNLIISNKYGKTFECVAGGLKRDSDLSQNKVIEQLSEFILRLHGVTDEKVAIPDDEPTFNVRREGNKFYLSFGRESSNSEKVIDALRQLDNMNLEKSIDRSKPVLLEGRVSIQVISAITLRLQQHTKVIAIYDTVDDKYIVVYSIDEKYKLGDKIL